jgi:hypothetical protein
MILKLIKLELSHFKQLEESDSSQIENFESLVDLFTLLSFVLIISTFLFGYQRVDEYVTTLQTMSEFREVHKGNAPPVGLPENTLIIVHTVESNNDMIYLVESGKSPEVIYYLGQNKSLWSSLEEKKSLFMDSNDIQIIINNTANKVNAELFMIIQSWLAQYSLKATINFNSNVNAI